MQVYTKEMAEIKRFLKSEIKNKFSAFEENSQVDSKANLI